MLNTLTNARRIIHAFIMALMMGAAASAVAFEKTSFTMEEFDQLKAEGKPILIDVYATWCPTCKKQQTILENYFTNNPDSELNVLHVNFDTQKKIVSMFKAPRQSTLILFKGEERIWFSVAETRPEVIEKNIAKALN